MDSKRYALLKKRVHFYHKVRSIQERAPIIVLLAAAIIGLLTGLVGVAFQYAVQWVIAWRIYITTGLVSSIYLQIIGCFTVSGLMAASAYFLVKHVAPESGGSGIPEIEGALANLRPVRWKRVLPVKFIGGLGALGSGMILGREGPTVQIGGNLGKMVADFFHVRGHEYHHTFIAVGAAAGVTAAFNAPLAGVLFIIEEMRPQFRYNLTSIKAILVGVIMASVMYQCLIDSKPIFNIGYFSAVPVKSLWLYLCLGVIFGFIGVISNKSILACQGFFRQFYQQKPINFLFVGVLLGGTFGILTLVAPSLTGGGFSFIPEAISGHHLFTGLFIIFILRFIGSIICFSSGAPGGIFAPTLALGTIFGVLFGIVMQGLLPDYHIELGACAIIGMGALFASTIRAPLTGIVLVMEMTDNYQLILPMIITCLGSTLMAQMLGGKPLYSEILDGILLRSVKQSYQKGDRDD